KGDIIGAEKFENFMQKGLEGIYVNDEDVLVFLEWLTEIREAEINETVSEVGEATRELAVGVADVREKVYETFFGQELTDEIVENLKNQVTEFVSQIREQPFSQKTIAALTKRNSTIADHSVNVA